MKSSQQLKQEKKEGEAIFHLFPVVHSQQVSSGQLLTVITMFRRDNT